MALVVLYLLLLFGFFVPTVSVLISLLLIAGSSLQFSFGKIDHNVLFVLVPLAMARSGWGNRYTLARASEVPNRSGPCLGVFAIVVGFAMFTAGFQKLTTGWLQIRTHESYGQLIYSFYSDARDVLLAPVHTACPVPRVVGGTRLCDRCVRGLVRRGGDPTMVVSSLDRTRTRLSHRHSADTQHRIRLEFFGVSAVQSNGPCRDRSPFHVGRCGFFAGCTSLLALAVW